MYREMGDIKEAKEVKKTYRTMAIHLAIPTIIKPSLRSGLSGRKAQARPVMNSGAIIQFKPIEMIICIQIFLSLKTKWSVSYRTLHKIGYIMTSKPTAMGTETSTKVDCCRAGPVAGTRLERMIPRAMARMIHNGRNRSRIERPLSGVTFDAAHEPVVQDVAGRLISFH